MIIPTGFYLDFNLGGEKCGGGAGFVLCSAVQ